MTAESLPTTREELCVVHAPPPVAPAERRTRAVIGLSLTMMVAELVVGTLSHSLALVADGWHMATHVGALALTAFAYWYARTRAGQERFAFGTAKVSALAGYTSAGALVAVAVSMAWEAVVRLRSPETVDFMEALPVAVLGLMVNVVSALLLDGASSEHDHAGHDHAAHGHSHPHGDSNLRAAYLHVVADALTSLLAIAALLSNRFWGWAWADPVVALVGAVWIGKWGLGLIKETSAQLLDIEDSQGLRSEVRRVLETPVNTRVVDLHLWSLSAGRKVCVVALEARSPLSVEAYRAMVLAVFPVTHLTIEVRQTQA